MLSVVKYLPHYGWVSEGYEAKPSAWQWTKSICQDDPAIPCSRQRPRTLIGSVVGLALYYMLRLRRRLRSSSSGPLYKRRKKFSNSILSVHTYSTDQKEGKRTVCCFPTKTSDEYFSGEQGQRERKRERERERKRRERERERVRRKKRRRKWNVSNTTQHNKCGGPYPTSASSLSMMYSCRQGTVLQKQLLVTVFLLASSSGFYHRLG